MARYDSSLALFCPPTRVWPSSAAGADSLTHSSVGSGAILAGCVAAPVQEMSDARQAINAAAAAGAATYSSAELIEAQRLLGIAEGSLNRGDYSTARRYAVSARKTARQAREQAQAASEDR